MAGDWALAIGMVRIGYGGAGSGWALAFSIFEIACTRTTSKQRLLVILLLVCMHASVSCLGASYVLVPMGMKA